MKVNISVAAGKESKHNSSTFFKIRNSYSYVHRVFFVRLFFSGFRNYEQERVFFFGIRWVPFLLF